MASFKIKFEGYENLLFLEYIWKLLMITFVLLPIIKEFSFFTML